MLIISKNKTKIKALKKCLTRKFEIDDLGPIKILYRGKNYLK